MSKGTHRRKHERIVHDFRHRWGDGNLASIIVAAGICSATIGLFCLALCLDLALTGH
jgi:hypothetical protein